MACTLRLVEPWHRAACVFDLASYAFDLSLRDFDLPLLSLLPALARFMPLRAAMVVHALLFGLHHRAVPALIPLSVLGLLWAALYLASSNLLVPIFVHALWNSRIFLTSLLDLVSLPSI